jgi:hypothetical protein
MNNSLCGIKGHRLYYVIGISCPCISAAHNHCGGHREEILISSICGCFYCLSTFIPQAIQEWTDKDTTAICPHCGIDAVIGSESGYPITKEFLTEMYNRWFDF